MNRAAPGRRSRTYGRRAARVLVGGVDSPVRSFRSVGGAPVFFARGRGAYLIDVDGRRYLDLVSSWGANLFGNAPPGIVAAVRRTAPLGLTFGAPSPLEHELAERIRRAAPSLELLRFVSSGTEAVMSAVRVARGVPGRTRLVKFAGGYHGHSDGLLARAGSGVATHSLPDSAGVSPSVVRETLVARYNDQDGLADLFERHGPTIAAVVVEPVAGNMGVVPPRPGFLQGISALARHHGALVIADEVITGFRLRRGTVHESLGLSADLVTLGKVVGGGMPVGVYGGRRKVMETLAPLGPVYQSGTLAGHPLAMAAGRATLDRLTPGVYRLLERTGASLAERMSRMAEEERVDPFTVQRVGSMLGAFFAPGPIEDDRDAGRSDRARYARFFHAVLDGGVYLPPSALETTFVSTAIQPRDLDRAEPALRAGFRAARVGAG
ncbi:MAG: glutamate-1-semialdehyde 2,1-aminomutase [Thermoplasmata archaeon]